MSVYEILMKDSMLWRLILNIAGFPVAGSTSNNTRRLSRKLSNMSRRRESDFETSTTVKPVDSFDSMGLSEDLIRGIYAYGTLVDNTILSSLLLSLFFFHLLLSPLHYPHHLVDRVANTAFAPMQRRYQRWHYCIHAQFA